MSLSIIGCTKKNSTQAMLAQQFGCEGLLIYSDPIDYAPEGVPVYPDGPSLPLYGVQRGSLSRTQGDLLTPGIPATGKVEEKGWKLNYCFFFRYRWSQSPSIHSSCRGRECPSYSSAAHILWRRCPLHGAAIGHDHS